MFLQSKLYNNSVLTGPVDCYCLVCDNYLRSEDDAYTHMEKPIHKKNMESAVRLEKYKNDQIIKVKKGYYCPYCNILLSTTTKVGLHINDTRHHDNKSAQTLHRIGDNIAYNEVAISGEAWHGIMDNTCMICNTEFDNQDAHRRDKCHILKLIQSKCVFGDNYVYRQVDGESFHCLICANVFSMQDKPEHHEDINHNTLYHTSVELKNKTSLVTQLKTEETPKILTTPKTENISKHNDLTDITRSSDTDNNNKNIAKAVSAKKKEPAVKSNNILPKNLNENVVDTSKPLDAKKINTGTAKSVDAKMDNTTDPAKSANTKKTEAKLKKMKPVAKTTNDSTNEATNNTQRPEDFIDHASKVINTNKDPEMQEYLRINNYMVHEEDNSMRCVVCDIINIRPEDVGPHISNDLHHQMMLQKHRENLLKKVNGSTAQVNETVPVDDLKKDKKINLKNPEKLQNNTTEYSGKPKDNTVALHQQLNLKLYPPLDIQSKIRRQNPDSDISSDEENDAHANILDNVEKYQHNDINIDFTSEKARCKRCEEYVPFDFASLEEHIQNRHAGMDYRSINREIELKAKIESFTRDNFMVVLENEAYCKLCSCGLALNLKILAGHANLSSHKDKVMTNDTGPQIKVQASDFMQMFFRVDSSFGSDIIVNNAYVLRYHSFHCVMQDKDSFICGLCDIEFPKDSGDRLTQHLNSFDHKQKMGHCNVVSSLSEEFIREVTPGVYHCGYCNEVSEPWSAMEAHLLTTAHATASRHARWHLERCHTVIRNTRPQQHNRRSQRGYSQADFTLAYGIPVTEWSPIPEHPPASDQPPPVPDRPDYTHRPISLQYLSMLQDMQSWSIADPWMPPSPE